MNLEEWHTFYSDMQDDLAHYCSSDAIDAIDAIRRGAHPGISTPGMIMAGQHG